MFSPFILSYLTLLLHKDQNLRILCRLREINKCYLSNHYYPIKKISVDILKREMVE